MRRALRRRCAEPAQGLAALRRARAPRSACVGWQLGGYRLALAVRRLVVLLGAVAATGTPTGSRWGWSARGSCCSARRRRCTRRSSGSRRARACRRRGSTCSPDGYPRALSAGRGPRGGVGARGLAGLLGVATPAELEGILAHELAHLRNRDVLVQTIGCVMLAGGARRDERGSAAGFQRALLFVLGAARRVVRAPAALAEARVRRRPLAAELCGRRTGSRTRCSGSSRRSELVAVPGEPGDRAALHDRTRSRRRAWRALFVTHPPVGERVRRLRELDPDWREKLRAA